MTSLNTQIGKGGLVITDQADKHCFTIKYNCGRGLAYRLEDADGKTVSEHKSSQAAEYRALSEYLDAQWQ